MFKPATWECTTCHHRNEWYYKKCGACQVVKPGSTAPVEDVEPQITFDTVSEEKPQALPESTKLLQSTSVTSSSSFRFGGRTTPLPASTGRFVFGPPKSDVTQAASCTFVFGPPKSDVTQAASRPFVFGPGAVTKPLSDSSFAGFTQNQRVRAITASVQPSFNFGSAPSNTVHAVIGGFDFNAPSSNPNSSFTFGAKTTRAAPNPDNNMGALVNPNPPPKQMQDAPESFSFESSASSQTPMFKFGFSSQDGPQVTRHAAAPPPAGDFIFGSQPNITNPTAPPSFIFDGTLPPGTSRLKFNFSPGPASGQS